MRSPTPRPEQRTPFNGRTQLAAGMPTILVGFLTYMLSNVFDSGVLHGLFLGATIALMVLGAYLVGAGLSSSRKNDKDLGKRGHWLPSRDWRGEGTR